jgi:hypothetical protein
MYYIFLYSLQPLLLMYYPFTQRATTTTILTIYSPNHYYWCTVVSSTSCNCYYCCSFPLFTITLLLYPSFLYYNDYPYYNDYSCNYPLFPIAAIIVVICNYYCFCNTPLLTINISWARNAGGDSGPSPAPPLPPYGTKTFPLKGK